MTVGFGPAPWSGTTPPGTDDGKVVMAWLACTAAETVG